MNKDKSILDLLTNLKRGIDFGKVEVVDNWETDLCAIGLKSGNKLVYISTYNNSVLGLRGYDFDFEILDAINIEKVRVVKEWRGVSEENMIKEINAFFEL